MCKWIKRSLVILMIVGFTACTDVPVPVDHTDSSHTYSKENEVDLNEESSLLEKVKSTNQILDISLQAEVPNNLPMKNHAFIVLGSALTDDGKIKETLKNRLQVALKAARTYPNSKLILSGGAPKNGNTEADVMYDWFVMNGVDKKRLIKEDASTDTLENAKFSLTIAHEEKIKDITLITSASHMRRALTLFNEINQTFDQQIENPLSHIVYLDYDSLEEAQHVTAKEKTKIYLDLLRAAKQ